MSWNRLHLFIDDLYIAYEGRQDNKMLYNIFRISQKDLDNPEMMFSSEGPTLTDLHTKNNKYMCLWNTMSPSAATQSQKLF